MRLPWGLTPQEDVEAVSKRPGNMVLLKHRVNSEQDNSDFQLKVPHFRASAYVLTKEVAEHYREWGLRQIEERQRRLVRLAVSAWPAGL